MKLQLADGRCWIHPMQNPHVCTKACIAVLEAAHATHRLQDT